VNRFIIGFSLLFVSLAPDQLAAEEFKLVDGDRVVWVGNVMIEREQRYGYWELALTARFPERNITFRNLGWSGDNVFGEAQARFGSVAEGFRHLKEHVTALNPTVILAGYGGNEAFDGEAGLPRFRKGLEANLDMLAATKARIVLLAPLRQEKMGAPLPDPTEHNRNLRLYRDVLKEVAEKRGYPFVDLYTLVGEDAGNVPAMHLTDNGIHLTAYGYWKAASALEKGLGLERGRWLIDLDKGGNAGVTEGVKLADIQASPLRFQATDTLLPVPPAPPGGPAQGTDRVLRVRGLPAGKYTLRIDDKPVVTNTEAEWATGVKLTRGPEFDQVEKLRSAIIDKNQLFFHRWRPQNETYLFLFRKGEQGQNAKEVPQFDPLIVKQEEEIAKLRVPMMHRYELKKEE